MIRPVMVLDRDPEQLDPRTAIRTAIADRGLKCQWVATRVGVSRTHLSKVLSGARPLPASLRGRLCDLLAIPTPDEADQEGNAA